MPTYIIRDANNQPVAYDTKVPGQEATFATLAEAREEMDAIQTNCDDLSLPLQITVVVPE